MFSNRKDPTTIRIIVQKLKATSFRETAKVEILNSPENKEKPKPVIQNNINKIRFFLLEKLSRNRTKNPAPSTNNNAGIIILFVCSKSKLFKMKNISPSKKIIVPENNTAFLLLPKEIKTMLIPSVRQK